MAVIRDVMPAFELFQPSSVADAQKLLEQHGPDAWVLAGGLDSFDWLKDRIKKPKVVVDLSRIAGTPRIRDDRRRHRNRRHDHAHRSGAPSRGQGEIQILLAPARKPPRRRRSATRAPWAVTSPRIRAAGITAAAGIATAPAATSAMPIPPRPSTASTPFWAPTAAWPSILPIRRRPSSRWTPSW